MGSRYELMSDEALQLLIHMDRLFVAGDLAAWVACVDDDVVYRNFNDGPVRGEWVGKDAALVALLGGATGGYGDASYDLSVTGYRSVGDDLAAMDWTLTVTPTDGEPTKTRGCQLFRVREDKVVEVVEVAERQARDVGIHLLWKPPSDPAGRFAPAPT